MAATWEDGPSGYAVMKRCRKAWPSDPKYMGDGLSAATVTLTNRITSHGRRSIGFDIVFEGRILSSFGSSPRVARSAVLVQPPAPGVSHPCGGVGAGGRWRREVFRVEGIDHAPALAIGAAAFRYLRRSGLFIANGHQNIPPQPRRGVMASASVAPIRHHKETFRPAGAWGFLCLALL